MPRGRPPHRVDPDASCAARLGAEIRARRVAANLTLDALSGRIGYSTTHVSEVERGRTFVSRAFVEACDGALDAGGQLLALLPAVRIEQLEERESRESARRSAASVEEDVRRRAFLGLGFAAVLFGPEAVARALSEAEAEQVTFEWSRALFMAPDRQALLPGLVADLKRLKSNGGPQRAVALLSAYVAMIAASGGQAGASRRWWMRAQAAADASGDSHIAAFVAGQHAAHALYADRDPARALTLSEHALALTSAPCAGRMHALGTVVRASAVTGRQRAAREALVALERTFEQLPRHITREKAAVSGWAEDRLHHTHSYAAAFGGISGGDAARDAALALYAPAAWRLPAQVKLHQAAGEVDPQHAVAALAELSEAQRADRSIRFPALQTLSACRARGADVRELREVLA
jgi:transcriptional regulator with XRE-family HTH domain